LKASYTPNLYVALAHYPVINKNGDIIVSAVTSVDLHDVARNAKTYGIPSFYVVTPLADQKKFVEKLILHWISGTGSTYNPKRREAMKLIRIKSSLDEVTDHIRSNGKESPKIVVTSACQESWNLSFFRFRDMLKGGGSYLLVFGTAWGLSKEFIRRADYLLEPIVGNGAYNHLSVRSASAIIMDRLLRRGK